MEEYQPILSAFFNAPLSKNFLRRGALLFAEGLCAGLLGLYVMHALGIQESGSISIFLVAAVLVPRFNKLLEENKDLIWQDMSLPRRANRLTAYSILALFLGIMSAYVLTAIFFSKGIMKYATGADEGKQVFAAVLKLVLISWLLLLGAALLESHWAPWVLESLG